jgi:hypothetical protein
LKELLDELRAEYLKVPNTEKRVFTRDGKPIPAATLHHAFDKAVKDAKVEDFMFKDFRHCAGRYVNLTENQIRDAFREMFTRCLHEKKEAASAGK